MPETYLWQAIFVTLFCCLPVGIYAIIKASDVSGMYSRGQYELALVRSNEARSATNLALILGLLVGVGWFVFVVRLGGAFGRF